MSAFYSAVTAQKSKNILHEFIPIQFVVQFMPRFGIQLELESVDTGFLQPTVYLPHAFSIVPHRIFFTGQDKDRQFLWHTVAPLLPADAMEQAE